MNFPDHKSNSVTAQLLLLLFFLVAGLVIAGGLWLVTGLLGLSNPWDNYLRLSVQTVVLFGMPAFAMYRISGTPLSLGNGTNTKKILPLAGLGLLAWTLSLLPVHILWELNRKVSFPDNLATLEQTLRALQYQNETFVLQLVTAEGWVHLIMIVLVVAALPAVFEELLFRGCLQTILTRGLKGKWAPVLISAVVFSAFHGEFFSFLPRILLGVVLGLAFYAARSLWLPIFLHFINNLVSIIIYRTISPDSPDIFGSNTYSITGLILLVPSLILLFLVFRTMEKSGIEG